MEPDKNQNIEKSNIENSNIETIKYPCMRFYQLTDSMRISYEKRHKEALEEAELFFKNAKE
jgi:hypothetical protein